MQASGKVMPSVKGFVPCLGGVHTSATVKGLHQCVRESLLGIGALSGSCSRLQPLPAAWPRRPRERSYSALAAAVGMCKLEFH